MTRDILFEIGTEELPSGAVKPLSESLSYQLLVALDKRSISYVEHRIFATPRRIALWIIGVEECQPEQQIYRRGPALANSYDANGQPSPALNGFAKSCGVSVEQLTTVKTDKGEWIIFEAVHPGEKTQHLLPVIIEEALSQLSIAKPMHWGEGLVSFARPVHWGLLLYGSEVIVCDVLGITTGCNSRGHRYHHPDDITIVNPQDYEALLYKAYVVADFEIRKQKIIEQVNQIAQSIGGIADMPDALVDEVASIVEWPCALLIDFDERFLAVPSEALIAAMQSHQKCFPVRSSEGKLLPHCITVANIESKDIERVRIGNTRVIEARLSDASFFYQQDKKRPLADYHSILAAVVFQNKLGTLQDKTERLGLFMEYLSPLLRLNATHAERAAFLSRCDLMTGMVGEFPELQGTMGYYYAISSGETPEVAIALYEQYYPRFSDDVLPKSLLGCALSLSDRLDTIAGLFAIEQKPSGVKDPFKLRRHALAIVRLLMGLNEDLGLRNLCFKALEPLQHLIKQTPEAVVQQMVEFILERLRSHYQSRQIESDILQAVLAVESDSISGIEKRLRSLVSFLQQEEESVQVIAAAKRTHNLLRQSSSQLESISFNADKLVSPFEQDLYHYLQKFESELSYLLEEQNFSEIFKRCTQLAVIVNQFFEHVMVMVEDKRERDNRLCLVVKVNEMLSAVADFSQPQNNG